MGIWCGRSLRHNVRRAGINQPGMRIQGLGKPRGLFAKPHPNHSPNLETAFLAVASVESATEKLPHPSASRSAPPGFDRITLRFALNPNNLRDWVGR